MNRIKGGMFESAECWAGIVDVVGAWAVLEVLSQQAIRVPQTYPSPRPDQSAQSLQRLDGCLVLRPRLLAPLPGVGLGCRSAGSGEYLV